MFFFKSKWNLFCQLLYQPLGLIHGQEFGDANTNKCGQILLWMLSIYSFFSTYRILEFRVDLSNNLESFLQFGGGRVHRNVIEAKHWRNLCEHWKELRLEGQEFAQTLFDDWWELQQSECVTSWGSVEENDLKVHGLHQSGGKFSLLLISFILLDHLGKTGGLVDARQSASKFGEKALSQWENVFEFKFI